MDIIKSRLKLTIPINSADNPQISQLYGQNRAMYQRDFGIEMKFGHQSLDWIATSGNKLGYGAKILAMHDFEGVTIESDFPSKKRGNGIYLRHRLSSPILVNGLWATDIESVYWHLADFCITPSTKGKAGDVIGLMGNTGYVFPKPTQVNPYFGTHAHVGIRFYNGNTPIITQFAGNYVDPLPYLFTKGQNIGSAAFLYNDLMIGSYGDQVSALQSLLTLEGTFADEPTGQFGPRTFKAVVTFQKLKGISATGYVGPKTRSLLNNIYA